MFYFRAIYQNEVDESQDRHDWFDAQLPTLLAWHAADPADQDEIDRCARIRAHQGNDNPFIVDASLADRAYGSGTGELPVRVSVHGHTRQRPRAPRLDDGQRNEQLGLPRRAPSACHHSARLRPSRSSREAVPRSKRNTYRFTTATLAPGTHRFRLRQVDLDGTSEFSPVVELTIPALRLSAYPNPATSAVRITRPEGSTATVYDLLGRTVATLAPHDEHFDVSALPSGLYLIRAAGQTITITRAR